MDWFTADPHFGHFNIIRHCNRPFATAAEMDEEILRRWNDVLRPGDRLHILGDFCGQRRREAVIQSYLDRINLNDDAIVLILGNHDDEQASRRVFRHVHVRYTYKGRRDSPQIVLDHYALRVWNGSGRGVWHLYGHSHGNLPEDPHALSMDCGVDSNDFRLLAYDYVAAHMAKKTWRPVDHHGSFEEHLERASEEVSKWPEWKQNLLGGAS
jgi:calcineurin-like phosphoesterase family protein